MPALMPSPRQTGLDAFIEGRAFLAGPAIAPRIGDLARRASADVQPTSRSELGRQRSLPTCYLCDGSMFWFARNRLAGSMVLLRAAKRG
jgi:hypothetical protein